MIMRF